MPVSHAAVTRALDVRRVVVPLDGSAVAAQALPVAGMLAGLFAAPLHLVRVVDPEHLATPLSALLQTDALAWYLAAEYERGVAQEALAATTSDLAQRHIGSTCEVREGPAATEIVAATQPGDLLVMTTHGRSGPARWVLGSVAEAVIRRVDVPVLLLRAGVIAPAPLQVQRLVVPLDGSARAEEALPVASALASRLRIPLHLLTVIDVSAEMTVRLAASALVPGQMEDEILQLRLAAERRLADGLGLLQDSGIPATTDVLTGRAESAICRAVTAGDVIVMTSHGRTGLPRLFLGSVAEGVVRHAPVPVLLVRTLPEALPGRQSPEAA